jgi:hypothetical protein
MIWDIIDSSPAFLHLIVKVATVSSLTLIGKVAQLLK